MTPTVKIAKQRLDKWSARRILVPSVPFNRRQHCPWIQGPHGSTTTAVPYRAGAVGRS